MKDKPLSAVLEALGPFDLDALDPRAARSVADAWYRQHGRKHSPKLLSATSKMRASDSASVGIILRPGNASGLEACQWRTAGCTAVCVLETSFRGKESGNRDARDLRTWLLFEQPQAFITLVAHELRLLAARHGTVKFRPNVASDLRWEYIAPALFDLAGVYGYDYTKADPLKHRGSLPNYTLTYSVSEVTRSETVARKYMANGGRAAVVFDSPKHGLPATWHGFTVIDGDIGDDRTLDPPGVVVGLSAKADAKVKLTAGPVPIRLGRSLGFVKEGVAS